jgi:hypothetical protein
MKRSIYVLAIVAMASFTTIEASAQVSGKKEQSNEQQQDRASKQDKVRSNTSANTRERAQQMTDKLNEVVGLSADQQKKAMEANLRYLDAVEAMKMRAKESGNPDKEAMKGEKDRITRERLNEYKSFLSADQWAKFEDRRGEVKDSREERVKNSEKYQNMTPEERERMREKKQSQSGMSKEEKQEKMQNMSDEEKEMMRQKKQNKNKASEMTDEEKEKAKERKRGGQ